ncbi:hypothetical protein [Chitinophaga sp. YR627]|uniref:hypothetical protein n=1 Tax=Chitinophaga sp. YR627 TaxID=1881041 RepID=UPI0011608B64|nr:hypothetical protein [Chitinophaga sp. YR627]
MNRKTFILSFLFLISSITFFMSCNPVFKAVERQDPDKRKTENNNPVSIMVSEDLAYGQTWLTQRGIDTLTLIATDGSRLQGYYLPASSPSGKLAVLKGAWSTYH